MKRFALTMFAAALLIGTGYVLAAETRTVETEVRINARQLDDGRTEFALQQREGDGWGERMLVQRRFLDADVGHSRWLNSSPFLVSVEVEASGSEPLTDANSFGDTNAETANLWVYLTDEVWYDGSTDVNATVLMPVDLETFELDLIVAAGTKSGEYCNASPIFEDIPSELGCTGLEDRSHTSVTHVAAAVDVSYAVTVRYKCTKQDDSTEAESIWACWIKE